MEKISFYIFCCFFLWGSFFSQSKNNQENRVNLAFISGSINLKSSNESTPLVEDTKKGMFINARIDGKNYNFLVDTGFTFSAIDENLNINLESLGIKRPITDNFGLQKETELYKFDFSVENNTFKDFVFLKLNLSEVSKVACVKIDGIIGINVLKKLNWKMLKNENKLFFSNIPYSYEGFSEAIPLEFSDNYFPILKMQINKKEFYAGLDTGANSGIQLSTQVYNSIFKDYEKLSQGKGNAFYSVVDRNYVEIKKTKIKKILIGNLSIENYNVIVSQGKPILGQKILLNDDLILNFTSKELAFGNKFLSKLNSSDFNSLGLCRSLKERDKIELCFIWDDSKNFKNLKIGDFILQVDSINTTNISDVELCNLKDYLSNSKSNIKLKLQRGDKQFTQIIN